MLRCITHLIDLIYPNDSSVIWAYLLIILSFQIPIRKFIYHDIYNGPLEIARRGLTHSSSLLCTVRHITILISLATTPVKVCNTKNKQDKSSSKGTQQSKNSTPKCPLLLQKRSLCYYNPHLRELTTSLKDKTLGLYMWFNLVVRLWDASDNHFALALLPKDNLNHSSLSWLKHIHIFSKLRTCRF